MSDRLDELVRRLSSSDDSAAEELYAEIAPYLRLVVRRNLPRRLRAKFDSVDIVQSVWADFIDGLHRGRWRFEGAAQLRAFLLKSARNRLIDRVRQFRVAAEHERPLSSAIACRAGSEARPSQHAQANDLWERMFAVCPVEHRELLTMKTSGASLAAIATRTGLHVDSIRRILRRIVRQVSLDPAQSEANADSAQVIAVAEESR
jgi:RNA polymerase sigma factor (sigma-70 family)